MRRVSQVQTVKTQPSAAAVEDRDGSLVEAAAFWAVLFASALAMLAAALLAPFILALYAAAGLFSPNDQRAWRPVSA